MNQTSTNDAIATDVKSVSKATAPFPFTLFQEVSGGDSVDLSPSLSGGGAAMVLNTTTSDWDEVVCIWTDGVTFAPKEGNYFVFWFKRLPGSKRPTPSDILGFLKDKGEAGPPGTINLHPPPTPDAE